MHPELMALMMKFELCYQLPDSNPTAWLAPQLLDPSKLDALKDWGQPGDLVLRYAYEVMPKGLLSRLMVRQHRYVPDPNMAWRSGVLFERDGNQLLVESPYGGSEIILRARGSECKELLTLIAADLDALNETFPGLRDKVMKRIPCICSKCVQASNPESFDFFRLKKRREDGKMIIECPFSYEEVSVTDLLDGVFITDEKVLKILWAEKNAINQAATSNYRLTIVRKHLEKGSIKDALKLLSVQFEEATLLLAQFSDAEKKFLSSQITHEEFIKVQSKVLQSALNLIGK
ncbi:MAG TPA: COR domain-containing protein [Saprospiraceae bacterium]|nr:COR domain-containing protein [Saprospiraceae bacterium]